MKKSFKEIIDLLNTPAVGNVNKSTVSSEESWLNLLLSMQEEAIKFLKKYFGKDWDSVTSLVSVFNTFTEKLENMADNECPYTLFSRFKDLLLPHVENSPAAIVAQLEKALKPGRRENYGFYGHASMKSLKKASFDVKQMCFDTVRRFFNQVFEAWEERQSLNVIYSKFVERINNLKDDEDPFVLTHRFLSVLRQVDVLDWRTSGEESLRAMNRKSNKLAKADKPVDENAVHVGTNKSQRYQESKNAWTEDLPSRFQQPYEAIKDVFFPCSLSDDRFDQFIERENLTLSLDGQDDDGVPLVRVIRDDRDTWAIYRAEEVGYKRIYSHRLHHSGPVSTKTKRAA